MPLHDGQVFKEYESSVGVLCGRGLEAEPLFPEEVVVCLGGGGGGIVDGSDGQDSYKGK